MTLPSMPGSSCLSGLSMIDLAKYLFPIPRSLTGDGISRSFSVFRDIHPEFQTLSFKSGTQVFDWTIPQVWNVNNAYIEHESGKKYCLFSANNLHLVGYSDPIDTVLDKHQLLDFLYSREDLPDAIPYVTNYYSKGWGFCISHNELKALPEGRYRCFIDSSFRDGSLDMLELILPGQSDEEIFFSSYLCHPQMANNELSGPVVISQIIKYLKALENRRYTYRFVLLPETIGSIAYLTRRLEHLKSSVVAGFNLSCVGDDRRYTHLLSRKGDTLADQALSAALYGLPSVITKPFSSRGSDERQYNAPGVDLPLCGFSRSMFGDYPEYHTSLDDFTVVTQVGLENSLDVMTTIIDAFELGLFPRVSVLCEPQLGKRGLYPTVSSYVPNVEASRTVSDISIRNDVLAYSDGETSIFSLPNIVGCTLKRLIQEIRLLSEHNLLHLRGSSLT